jgi:hypothetical protein
LLAPRSVVFYSKDWEKIGSKDEEICSKVSRVTGIDPRILIEGNLDQCTVAEKMSWAAHRETTRVEDLAYCLLGIFDVNMPLLYGEGLKAFSRLQNKIMKSTEDQSLFAWGIFREIPPQVSEYPREYLLRGLFANSPSDFRWSGDIRWRELDWPGYNQSQRAVRRKNSISINLPVINRNEVHYAILPCGIPRRPDCWLAIPLVRWNNREYGRMAIMTLVTREEDIRLGRFSINESMKRIDVAPESKDTRLGTAAPRDILVYYNGPGQLSHVTFIRNLMWDARLWRFKPTGRLDGVYAALTFSHKRHSVTLLLKRQINWTKKEANDSTSCCLLSDTEAKRVLQRHSAQMLGFAASTLQIKEESFQDLCSSSSQNYKEVFPEGSAVLDPINKFRVEVRCNRKQLTDFREASHISSEDDYYENIYVKIST